MEEGGDGGDLGGFSWVGMMGYLRLNCVCDTPFAHTNVYVYTELEQRFYTREET